MILALKTPYFFTVPNIRNVLVQASTLSIIAAGLSIVLIAGEIDLAFAMIQAFVGSIAAVLMVHADFPWPLAMVLAICAGVAAGVTSAGVAIVARLPTFITTFAMLGITGGIGLLLDQRQPGRGSWRATRCSATAGSARSRCRSSSWRPSTSSSSGRHADASRAEDLRHRRLLVPRPCRPGSRGSER